MIFSIIPDDAFIPSMAGKDWVDQRNFLPYSTSLEHIHEYTTTHLLQDTACSHN